MTKDSGYRRMNKKISEEGLSGRVGVNESEGTISEVMDVCSGDAQEEEEYERAYDASTMKSVIKHVVLN